MENEEKTTQEGEYYDALDVIETMLAVMTGIKQFEVNEELNILRDNKYERKIWDIKKWAVEILHAHMKDLHVYSTT